jgi:WD40 repeat protein
MLNRRAIGLAIAMVGCGAGLWSVIADFSSATGAAQSGGISLSVHKEFDLATPGAAVAVAWSIDGSRLAAASNYGSDMTVWDGSGRLINKFKLGGGPTVGGSLEFIGGSSQLLFPPPGHPGDDSSLEVWDVATGRIIRSVTGPAPGEDYSVNLAKHFMISPDQKLAAAVPTVGGKVITYETKDWRVLQTTKIDGGVFSLCTFADGRLVAVGSFLGPVSVLDAMSGAMVTAIHAYDASEFGYLSIGAIAGSPSGDLLFAGVGSVDLSGAHYQEAAAKAWQKSIEPARVFRVQEGTQVASLTAATAPIRHAVWDPKGRYVAFVDNARGLFVWQPMLPAGGYKRIELSSPTLSLAVTPDGGRLAVTTDHGISVFALN